MPATDDRRTLYLLRHAKSSWDDPSLGDRDRPLASRGRRAAGLLASHLGTDPIEVDLVLCSSAVRARQTLELVLPSLGGPLDIRFEDRLYGAGAADLLARLRSVDESTRTVLVVGHNPALQDLTETLAGDGEVYSLRAVRQKYPTGALATLSTRSGWSMLIPGSAYLDSFVMPRSLESS
jgi:phosphohistidine phosphatase